MGASVWKQSSAEVSGGKDGTRQGQEGLGGRRMCSQRGCPVLSLVTVPLCLCRKEPSPALPLSVHLIRSLAASSPSALRPGYADAGSPLTPVLGILPGSLQPELGVGFTALG